METPLELAEGLQNSNIPEVSKICKGYLDLKKAFDQLQHDYVLVCGENVMIKHEKLFKKLVENGD